MSGLKDRLREKSMTAEYQSISKQMDEKPKDGEEIFSLDTLKIDPNPFQYRLNFDVEAVNDLGVRITKTGQLQPIGVRKAGDRYQIIWGEHRWRACSQIGIKVKAVIREATDEEMAELCFSENHDRTNPTAYEDYNAILIQKRMGKSAKEIQESLGLRPQDYYKLIAFENFGESIVDVIKKNLDVIGKTEAEALGKYYKDPDLDLKHFSDIVCEAIERLANGNVKSRKEMLAFVQKSMKPGKQGTESPAKDKKAQSADKSTPLLFESKQVGTYEADETSIKISISKEDLPQDKFAEFQKYVADFFEIK